MTLAALVSAFLVRTAESLAPLFVEEVKRSRRPRYFHSALAVFSISDA